MARTNGKAKKAIKSPKRPAKTRVLDEGAMAQVAGGGTDFTRRVKKGYEKVVNAVTRPFRRKSASTDNWREAAVQMSRTPYMPKQSSPPPSPTARALERLP